MVWLEQKVIFSKLKIRSDEQTRGPGIQIYNSGFAKAIFLHNKTKWRISDDFGLRSHKIQKPFQTKSATSIVARVHTGRKMFTYNSTGDATIQQCLTDEIIPRNEGLYK